MLRKFAIALVATTLIAGSAFAAQSSDNAGSASAKPAAPVTQTAPAANAKPSEKVSAEQTYVRKHVAHRKTGMIHQARHIKPAKTHQANVNAPAKRS
jgi:hypothetical protein